ncbi:MAG: winged helix-turn-helix transcriptional regulator [Oscillospiraceae bacterium]|nr:winged helix-turn-helix transcriptional regulator [Oscillospiraceae bacterium]
MNTCSYVHTFEEGADKLAEIHPEHSHIIEQTKANMPSEEILVKTAEFFKVVGDPTRIRILAALSEGEMCVCCLCDLLEMTQSAVSHQLSVLKAARLIKNRREGKQIYYSLDDAHVGAILCTGISHVEEG